MELIEEGLEFCKILIVPFKMGKIYIHCYVDRIKQLKQ